MELTQKQALFMMNYAQYATYKIRTYNNIAVLEDEYRNLKDNMNLELIKDESSVQTINDLMDLIHEERKNNKNRERLRASLERRMNNAIYESLPQVASVIVGGFSNPFGMVLNAAQTAGMMYMNYKKYKNQLSEEYDEKMWEYQQTTEDELNYIYRLLNTYSHQLIQQYGISDEWRLNENELSKMFDFLKDEDINRKYANLKNLSTDRFYSHFPLFWYHLSQIALDIGEEKKALEFYNRFEEENIPIFRYDAVAVDAYKGKISILLKNKDANIEEIKSKLEFIEKNKTSWNDYYFCGLVYANIGDTENAKRVLERNVNELAAAVDSDLMDKDSLVKIYTSNYELDGGSKIPKDDMFYSYYQSDAAKKPAKAPYNTLYDGLELSRNLLYIIGNEDVALESIQKQCKLNTTSLNESLYFFGRISTKKVAENSVSDIQKIKVTLENPSDKTSVVSCELPFLWMLSSDTKLVAVFKDSSGIETRYPLALDESTMKKLKKSEVSECSLAYRTERLATDWKKNGVKFTELILSHPIYPLSLKFCIDMNEENKNMIADFFSFNGKDFAIEKEVSANVSKKSAFAKLGEKISSAIPKGKLNEYYDSVAGVVGTGAKKVSSVLDKQKSKIYDCYDDLLDAAGSDAKNVTAKDLDDIVQFSAKGAAASSAAAGLIPGVGGAAATVCYAGFVWSMYVRLSKKIGIPFEKNILKALASAVVTNIAATAATALIATSIVSLVPGIGQVTASAVDAALGYAVVSVAGIVYMKILAKLMKAKIDLSKSSEEDLKQIAEATIKEVDVKALLKEAKDGYKSVKDKDIKIDESDAAEFVEDGK